MFQRRSLGSTEAVGWSLRNTTRIGASIACAAMTSVAETELLGKLESHHDQWRIIILGLVFFSFATVTFQPCVLLRSPTSSRGTGDLGARRQAPIAWLPKTLTIVMISSPSLLQERNSLVKPLQSLLCAPGSTLWSFDQLCKCGIRRPPEAATHSGPTVQPKLVHSVKTKKRGPHTVASLGASGCLHPRRKPFGTFYDINIYIYIVCL